MKVKELFNPLISSPDASPHLQPKSRLNAVILSGFAAILGVFLPGSVHAQSIMTFKPTQVRVEVPAGAATNLYLTNCNLRIPTNGATGVDGSGTNWIIADVNVSISGAPAGCTASLLASDLVTPVSNIPVALNTGNSAKNTNIVINLNFDGSQTSGTTTLTFTATGGGLPDDVFLLPAEVAKIWNGPKNASTGAGTWSDGTQWLGAGAPGPNDHVVFNDLGEQTNSVVTTSTTTNLLTSALITSDTTISSLRFAQTNGLGTIKTNWHNLLINPGVTLGIAGNDGFSMLRDYTYWNGGLMKVSIYGTNGTFIQTNENSHFAILSDAQQQSVLDMSGLGNLQMDVNQLNLSDYSVYPNYKYLTYSNNYSSTTIAQGKPQRFYQIWNMALTNVIKATYVDPFNYTNSESRSYALEIGRNEASGGGSGKDVEVFMGRSNVFNVDGICVAGSFCLGADFQFLVTNSYAMFRNTDGVSRMSIFATADAGGPDLDGGLGDNTKCGGNGLGVDFTKGTVDMLVDRLYLSMDRTNVTASGKGVSQTSGFFFVSGLIDANDAIFGYQGTGSHTNQCYCYAQVTVSNTAVMKINKNLALGYTTSTTPAVDLADSGYGQLSIGPGGTVYANNISIGGVSKVSGKNLIALTTGASLVVSNSLGDATTGGALGTLSFGGAGNNSLTLFIDGSKPAVPLVYVTNLTAAGTGNKLVIGAVTNVTFPVDIPLIAGVGSGIPISPSVFDGGVQMPAGMTGILSLSSSNTINIHIINRTPHHLVWSAPGSTATWDYTSLNWLDTDTGLTTNYNNPDIVTFDDASGHATNVVLGGGSDPLTPLVVNMTNNTVYYTFQDGGNSLLGGPALNKGGTGTVEVDGNTTLAAQVNQGNLVGTGSIGSANIAGGATMNFTGNVGGSVIDSGVATVSGIVSGTLTVQSGGVFTNAGTVNSPFSVKTNAFLYNGGTGALHNIGAASSASAQVAAGGILINAGTIGESFNGDILFVNGTFEDLATTGLTLSSVTVGSGGTFIPGGDGVANTTINSDGTGTYPGALLLQLGSTTVFKVDPSGPANTTVTSGHLSFGASATAQTQNGGTLVITNINGAPFAAGQSFKLFVNAFGTALINGNTGSSTNTYPTIVPASPGPGLAWDLRHLWVPDAQGHDGVIGVVNANSGPTFTSTYSLSSTNIVLQFSWDASNLGMRLESLTVPRSQGLNSTNAWTGIAGSWTTTTVNVTNNLSTNNVFYRLVFP